MAKKKTDWDERVRQEPGYGYYTECDEDLLKVPKPIDWEARVTFVFPCIDHTDSRNAVLTLLREFAEELKGRIVDIPKRHLLLTNTWVDREPQFILRDVIAEIDSLLSPKKED